MAMRSRQLKQKTPELLLSFQSEAPSYKDIDIDESKEEKDSQCYMSLSSYQIPQTSESFERIIIDTLKKEDSLDLQSKILFTYYINHFTLSHFICFYIIFAKFHFRTKL